MFGPSIVLKHEVSRERFRDFVAEAEHRRSISIALAARANSRRGNLAEARAAVASLLFRAGSWLMPEEIDAPHAFELRPGQ